MIFEGIALQILGGALAISGAALAALYLLKLRRKRVEVPSSLLWQRVLRDTQSSALLRRLRRLLSLLIQLALLLFLLLALADPRFGRRDRARTVVLLVDTSASMQTEDGAGMRPSAHATTRMEEAKLEAKRIVRGLSGDSSAMIVSLDAHPAPVGGFTRSADELERQIDALKATDAPADLVTALHLARDAVHGQSSPTLILVGDGAWSVPNGVVDVDLSGIDLRFASIGSATENVGITGFSVRRYQANRTAYEVLVEVESTFDAEKKLVLDLLQEGEVVQTEKIALKPNEIFRRSYSNLSGEGARLEARLRPDSDAQPLDLFPLDDRAYALLPSRQSLRVLLVSSGNLFLEGALLLDENIKLSKIAPGSYGPQALDQVDAVIFDRFAPTTPPEKNALYLRPEGSGSPFEIAGELASPVITDVAAGHPLTRWVTLKDLNIGRASRFRLQPGDVAVASASHDPIVVARDRAGRKTVAMGFELGRTDLPLRVAFPVLIVNALDWFVGADASLKSSFSTGKPVRIGNSRFTPMRVGFQQIGGEWIAVNLQSREESRIRPSRTLTLNRVIASTPPSSMATNWIPRREIWASLVLAALLLSLVEWWTYQRRITV